MDQAQLNKYEKFWRDCGYHHTLLMVRADTALPIMGTLGLLNDLTDSPLEWKDLLISWDLLEFTLMQRELERNKVDLDSISSLDRRDSTNRNSLDKETA